MIHQRRNPCRGQELVGVSNATHRDGSTRHLGLVGLTVAGRYAADPPFLSPLTSSFQMRRTEQALVAVSRPVVFIADDRGDLIRSGGIGGGLFHGAGCCLGG